jgi:hypothetical protein
MGEIADAMLDGDLCAVCGAFIDEEGGIGFPRFCCASCARDQGTAYNGAAPKLTRRERRAARGDKFEGLSMRKRDVAWLAKANPSCEIKLCPTAFARLEKLGFVKLEFASDDPMDLCESVARITKAGRKALGRARSKTEATK